MHWRREVLQFCEIVEAVCRRNPNNQQMEVHPDLGVGDGIGSSVPALAD
jgi:hypothetical protein